MTRPVDGWLNKVAFTFTAISGDRFSTPTAAMEVF
jgi:hypothetical protein